MVAEGIDDILGCHFKNKNLLEQALTTKPYSFEHFNISSYLLPSYCLLYPAI